MPKRQPPGIPWRTFASNFQWISDGPCLEGVTTLHARYNRHQGLDLEHFTHCLVQKIELDSICMRKKYPQSYTAAHPDEIILDNDTAMKIAPVLGEIRLECEQLARYERRQSKTVKINASHLTFEPCQHEDEDKDKCHCALPMQERRMAAFLRKYVPNDCNSFYDTNGKAFFNLEVVKMLVLVGDMDKVLRVCLHPDIDLAKWWQIGQCFCMADDAGWNITCELALCAFICLNVLRSLKKAGGKSSHQPDYRDSKCYQYMLRKCTMTGSTSDIARLPHRHFFGIRKGQFRDAYDFKDCYGTMPFDKFLVCQSHTDDNTDNEQFSPHFNDVNHVMWMLWTKGLPADLVEDIIRLAEYKPRALKVPHDPLHDENKADLERYLKYCWKVVVRSNVMANALGRRIPWRAMVRDYIVRLFGCEGDCKVKKWYSIDRDRAYCYDQSDLEISGCVYSSFLDVEI